MKRAYSRLMRHRQMGKRPLALSFMRISAAGRSGDDAWHAAMLLEPNMQAAMAMILPRAATCRDARIRYAHYWPMISF